MADDGLDAEWVGLEEMEAAMMQVGPELARNALTKAVEDGANFLAMEMKSRCPVGVVYERRYPGEMRDSIGIVPGKYNQDRPDVVEYSISPLYEKANREESPGYYCTFVEYGSVHNPHPTPFMRTTMDESGMEAIEIMIASLSAELEKPSRGTVTIAENT